MSFLYEDRNMIHFVLQVVFHLTLYLEYLFIYAYITVLLFLYTVHFMPLCCLSVL